MQNFAESYARERIARLLIEAGQTPLAADAIAAGATYTVSGGDVIVDIGTQRAVLSQPETVQALVAAVAGGKAAPTAGNGDTVEAFLAQQADRAAKLTNPLMR
jgi:hypothetical protein